MTLFDRSTHTRTKLKNLKIDGGYRVVPGYAVKDGQIGRRRTVPVLYVTGSHYEVGFDTVGVTSLY